MNTMISNSFNGKS